MITDDLLYQIALTQVPHIGKIQARILAETFGEAKKIFTAPVSSLEKIEGMGTVRANAVRHFKQFSIAEKELRFIDRYKVQSFFITDPHYPRRLLHCYDPPSLLFLKGNADLNFSRSVAIVGTRNNSNYGKMVTENFVNDIRNAEPVIISGLAFGIDTIAHRAALKNDLPTIAVLAHGLDTIYPPENNALAKSMVSRGGLLTEFISGTAPDKHNFPSRNRIVAGLSDATFVIETGIKGGSMITADLASGYNRDVFAVPGKISDKKSEGCNHLIQQNKAILYNGAGHFLQTLGWDLKERSRTNMQHDLFVDITEQEKIMLDLVLQNENIHIDELLFQSGYNSSLLSSILLSLEMKNLVYSLPGRRFRAEPPKGGLNAG